VLACGEGLFDVSRLGGDGESDDDSLDVWAGEKFGQRFAVI